MKIIGIIPARFASTRFPAKALTLIKQKPMIQWVIERASKSRLDEVLVATDHKSIFDFVKSIGGQVVMTSEEHPSGTDRCFEAYKNAGSIADFIINIQGDEPLIDPEQINLLINNLNSETELATLKKRITDQETLFNPNTPKVICDVKGNALYFSRQTLPYIRGHETKDWLLSMDYYKHIGIYGYRADILEKITRLPQGKLEKAESLEQLRWLEHGFKIKVVETEMETIGVDVPEDLLKLEPFLHLL